MKKYLLVFALLAAFLSNKAFAAPPLRSTADTALKTLPDGHYYADVSYYNYASNISAQYNLKIKVKDGFVTVIYLNNGGVVHTGINNENYLFTGGKINVSKDKKSGKLEYSAQVSISNGGSISSYNINIEKAAADDQ